MAPINHSRLGPNPHILAKRDDNSSMDTGAIVGIVIGVLVAIILIIWAIRSLSSPRQPQTGEPLPPAAPTSTYDDDYYPRRSSHRSRSRSHGHHHHHHHHSHGHRSRSRSHSRRAVPVVVEKPAAAYVYDSGDRRRSRSRSQGGYYTSYP